MSGRMRVFIHIALAALFTMSAWSPAMWAHADMLKAETRKFFREMKQGCQETGGQLKIDWKKFETRVDIDGDGRKDLIWHATPDAVRCTSAASYFCGTGGCSMLVVVDGRGSFEFLAQDWALGRLKDGGRLLFIGVHWAECDYADECRRILKWNPSRRTFDDFGLSWKPTKQE